MNQPEKKFHGIEWLKYLMFFPLAELLAELLPFRSVVCVVSRKYCQVGFASSAFQVFSFEKQCLINVQNSSFSIVLKIWQVMSRSHKIWNFWTDDWNVDMVLVLILSENQKGFVTANFPANVLYYVMLRRVLFSLYPIWISVPWSTC